MNAYSGLPFSNDELIDNYKYVSDIHGGPSISSGVIIGIGIGCAILVLSLLGVGIYAIRQKKRAEKAIGLSKPFGN